MAGLMLPSKRAGFLDKPPEIFQYGLPDHNHWARTFEPFIVLLLPDEEAVEALVDDTFRLQTAKRVWGKALQRPKGKRS